jgi:hypothetical protein
LLQFDVLCYFLYFFSFCRFWKNSTQNPSSSKLRTKSTRSWSRQILIQLYFGFVYCKSRKTCHFWKDPTPNQFWICLLENGEIINLNFGKKWLVQNIEVGRLILVKIRIQVGKSILFVNSKMSMSSYFNHNVRLKYRIGVKLAALDR